MSKPFDNPPGINVKAFERMDDAGSVRDYIHILDVFDGLAGIQRLKEAAIKRCRLKPGLSVLDVGCGIASSATTSVIVPTIHPTSAFMPC